VLGAMNMCPDYNIINCLSQLGAIYYGATFFGVIGLFLTPWLIWQAFAKRPGGVPRFDENQKMKIVFFRVFSFVAACTYAVAAFLVFPGVLFCSVFCFLGIGLPAIGITAAVPFVIRLFLSPYKPPHDNVLLPRAQPIIPLDAAR
jgi:hypothetical protein